MKGYFCLLIVLGIASCSKNDRLEDSWIPEQKKQVVIMQQTGTWCGACPGGATVLRNLVNEFESEVVPIAIHGGYDDPMRISCFSNFRSDRSYSGFPSFFIKMPRNVDSSRFLYRTTAPHTDCGGLTERNSEYRFIVLHLNSGTSGTTWMLRWLPSAIGKYFGKITFEIFVCDVQTRFSRAAAAGVRCHW